MLKYALLGFLSHIDLSGYDLERLINASTNYFWHAKLSQVYRTLKQMEESDLVTSRVEAQEGRPDRRVYAITDAGRSALQEWLSQYSTERDTFKIPSVMRFFFSGSVPKESLQAQLRIWLDMYQREYNHFLEELPREYDQLRQEIPHTPNDKLVWDMTYRFGILFFEMYVRWLQESMQMVEAHYQNDPPADE